ncbi:choline-binding protein [Lacticaseibacillus parahuelsenbergensis]|uniref:Choline-binding protein n=1 Tax=Lacticaseibacillus parahuelsenbergensis TaxID=3068305 RepID=A0ABY9L2N5_9LACO|nr:MULTISPECIES: choline-binding protein [Lacticaseibacillus]MDE3283821.1 choline-binding protein [Lacticaseibacillus casei]WLV77949.1 choline-binding protein [Lacticaseibacillus sp. NCIMB 15471]
MKKYLFKSVWTKAFVTGLALFALTGATTVSAAGGYWTISQERVSAYGDWSEFGSANVKQTNSNVASFNGDALPNSLGYNVRLINNAGEFRSDQVGLYVNSTSHADNNSGLAGYSYYADVRSSLLEPNQSTVKLHFSADNL